jgi:hypothetical protein
MNVAWVKHMLRMDESRNSYVLDGIPEEDRPFELQRSRLDYNIKNDLKGVLYDGLDKIILAQDSN